MKVSLAKIGACKRKPKRKPTSSHGRKVRVELLTPEGAPEIVRIQVTTPLTPRAVRDQILDAAADAPYAQRRAYIGRRLTPLDLMLDDAEAAALEEYATAEHELARAGAAVWMRVKVDTGGADGPDLIPRRQKMFARHARAKKRLSSMEIAIMAIFSAQMLGDKYAPTEYKAAQQLGMAADGEDAAARWRDALARIAKKLAA